MIKISLNDTELESEDQTPKMVKIKIIFSQKKILKS